MVKQIDRELRTTLLAAALMFLPSPASAQSLNVGQKLPLTAAQPLPPRPQQLAPAMPVRAPIPPAEDLLGLIRSTIIALNQANQTGNYTVLRDLAAPDFRNGNDASRLGAIFKVLREQSIDLAPLLHISPEVSETPSITPQGLLRLAGFFPTEPLRVNFDLAFQYSDRRWRPYTISVYLARVEAHAEPRALKQANKN